MRASRWFFSFFLLMTAVVSSLTAAPSNQLTDDVFISNWSITELIPASTEADMGAQQQAFSIDPLDPQTIATSVATGKLVLGDKSYKWKDIHSQSGIVDLVGEFGSVEYCYSYAVAEISCAKERKVLLGIGSDDAVKVWLNGQLIHENFTGRPVNPDDDLVSSQFKTGNNTLILKIYNMQQDWGFCVRPLGDKATADLMVQYLTGGNVENLALLLSNGVDPNLKIGPGLTPLQIAAIKGRPQMADVLIQAGADPKIPMPEKTAIVDYLFKRAIKENYPGASVLIAQDGKILYENGYGLANIEKSIPIEPLTTFRIGSITKQFTAAAILKLQEGGKLSVQDKLSKYIPDFPRGDEVTLHHLLTHTSGIHSFTETPNFLDKVTGDVTEEEMISQIKSLGYDFSPGESYLYNNSGFYILGYLVEKVSGMSLDAYLKKAFFQPLGMTQTGVYRKGLSLPHEALGYAFENGKPSLALDWNMDFTGGAGNLYSNVEDMYKWNEAVFTGKLLQPVSLASAFTPAKLNNGELANESGGGYGYGWHLWTLRGLQEISHSGWLNGFSTTLARLPEKNMTVIVLSNCSMPNIPNLDPPDLAQIILEVYQHDAMQNRKEYVVNQAVDAAAFTDYVGRYDYGQAILTVRLGKGQLYAQLSGQPEFPIYPSAPDKFFWKIVDAQIEFFRDENGRVTHGLHTQNGATINVPRIQESKVVAMPVETLAQYVGKYDYYGQAILTVRLAEDQLYAQLSGQPEFPIYPSAPDKFFWKVVDAQIEFVRDETGRVTHGLHTQNGTTITVPRIQESQAVAVPVEVLQTYVGDYELAPNFILTITLEGEQLFSQATGQQKVEIYPKSETEFFLKVVVASVTFVKDENGKVKSLILDQGPAHMEAPKIK
jgi:CubicO group peptidase (beta-lactamase class C family)